MLQVCKCDAIKKWLARTSRFCCLFEKFSYQQATFKRSSRSSSYSSSPPSSSSSAAQCSSSFAAPAGAVSVFESRNLESPKEMGEAEEEEEEEEETEEEVTDVFLSGVQGTAAEVGTCAHWFRIWPLRNQCAHPSRRMRLATLLWPRTFVR